MDFVNRNSPQAASHPSNSEGSAAKQTSTPKKGGKFKMAKAGMIALLFAITILVASLILLVSTSNNNASRYVNTKQLQAVFLNNGQVYFGNIKSLNNKYIDLTGIYYLRTDSSTTTTTTTSGNNISLVKLGCELHGPTDEMIINSSQLTFWENLKSDGQVAKAIATYKQQNPNGQNCSTASGTQTTPQATTPTNNSGTTTKP